MIIQSDSKPLDIFKKVSEFIKTWHFILLLNFCALGTGYLLTGGFSVLYIVLIAHGIIFVISGGESFECWCGFNKLTLVLFSLSLLLHLFFFPIKQASDTIQANEYIELVRDVESHKDKRVVVDMKKPFETGVILDLSDQKFVSDIIGFNKNDLFIFTITKKCSDFYWGEMECTTRLHANHKFEEKEIGNVELKKSIYPKKLEFPVKETK